MVITGRKKCSDVVQIFRQNGSDRVKLQQPFRIATTADAKELAELVNFAGEGLPLHVWTGMAGDGQDPWEIGRARQAEKAEGGQIFVADFGEGAVAGLTGYPIGNSPTEEMICRTCLDPSRNSKMWH